MPVKKINKKTKREMEVYNEAIRDAMKEVWLYDGIIPDEVSREYMVRQIQKKLSYTKIDVKELVLIGR